MPKSFGFRALVLVAVAFAILLAALAVIQYRWSGRVAEADSQREREFLESAMALFAAESDALLTEAVRFLRDDAREAFQAGEPIPQPPPVIGDLYYLQFGENGRRELRRRSPTGEFIEAEVPEWLRPLRCGFHAIRKPLALVVPVYEVMLRRQRTPGEERIQQAFRWRSERCFVAPIDEPFLREKAFPKLVAKSFGETTASNYTFAVLAPAAPGTDEARRAIYGTAGRVDLSRKFFAVSPAGMGPPGIPPPPPGPSGNAMIIQRIEIPPDAETAPLYGDGLLTLQVAHKGIPLEAAFARSRTRDLLLSLGVEALLLAGIVVLILGARRMQRLADQKMQFVAGVSHELRTPVSAIAMLSRNQADGLVEGPEKVKQYGELIHQQSRRLNEMVEQTLQFAGVHSGLRRPQKQEIHVEALLRETVEARRADLEAAGIETEFEIERGLPSFHGDAKLIETAIDNLVSNVLKYAGSGRRIRISAAQDVAARMLRIGIHDDGDGIDAADQRDLFEPFYRGKRAIDAQVPGSGLGLSLVRSAAEFHRGTVTLESEPGRGTTFTLHLPL